MPDNLTNICANYIKPAPIESTRRGLSIGAGFIVVAHLERPKNDFPNEIISDYFGFLGLKIILKTVQILISMGFLIRNKLVLEIR